MDRREAFELVKEVLVRRFDVDAERISSEAHLSEDLDLDSIDGQDMLGLVESNLKVAIDERELRRLRQLQRVSDVVDYIVRITRGRS
ncbi:MAG: hypothetical protein JXR96_24310 [Deltaproteobacteria bacterium]|nr:hypothetical protein [Deltaproteobacteria bacterium]